MRIKRFTIKNFKSIPPGGIDLEVRERFCILVGKNNAGKSNILEAISLLFGPKNPRYLRLGPESYNNPSHSIIIEVELEGLTWGDGKALGLSDQQCGSLMHEGKRVATSPGCITFRLTCPAAEGSGPSDEDEDESAKQTFEVLLANRHEVKRNEDIRKAVVKHILIPPIRSHSELLSPSTWTTYGRFLRDILAGSSQAERLAQLISEATTQLRDLLSDEAAELTRSAKATSYVDAIDFQLTKEGNPIELLRNLSLMVTYGSRTEDISQIGTGTQSAVIIGVLELCIRYRASRGMRLFQVEEPELFLHPHAQRYIASLLRSISEEDNNQIILTTHSSAILADTDILDVIRIDRGNKGATRCLRLPTDYPDLEKSQRILSKETCEMLFADRVVLVEGPSEAICLPRISRLLGSGTDSIKYSFDRHNVSVINVGGKEHLKAYSKLLDDFRIEWRVIADRDALRGNTLDSFKEKAGLVASKNDDQQIDKLRDCGVAVLRKGEIEDYYPHEALAAIKGCAVEDVPNEIEKHREDWDKPSIFTLLEAILSDNREEIAETDDSRLRKILKRRYDQALEQFRRNGTLAKQTRKTGDAIANWLKLSKPIIALRVSQWMEDNSEKVPNSLQGLTKWLLEGMETGGE